jgi:hypothetical protein
MLPFGVAIPATVPQRSVNPEGVMNYPVFIFSLQKLLAAVGTMLARDLNLKVI